MPETCLKRASRQIKILKIDKNNSNINMRTITLPRNFRITTPKKICDKLDVTPGQSIAFLRAGESLHLIAAPTEKQKVARRQKRATTRSNPAA